jgi:hypothetical protein
MKYLALFILAMILALAPLAHAAPIEYLFCAYTNAGDGGDEGYEVRILGSSSSEDALSASLSLIDPSGARVYREVPVQTATLHGHPGYVGEGFALELWTDRPKTQNGYTRARVIMPDEDGVELKQRTFCGFRKFTRG